jgi:hypothetical protein
MLARLLEQAEQAATRDDGAAAVALHSALAQLGPALADALDAVRAECNDADTVTPPSTAFVAEEAAAAAAALAHGLRRGALEDAALARLHRALHGHVPPAALDALHAALDDFDFSLAQARLDAVMAAIPHEQAEAQA